jgi:hypothetical protein
MTNLTIKDLSGYKEFDREEMTAVLGGFFPALRTFVADYDASRITDATGTPISVVGRKAGEGQKDF